MALAYSNSRDDVAASLRTVTPPIYPAAEPLPEYSESDAEELFGFVPPPPAEAQKLAAPLVLPQIATNYDSAFLRAYNPILEASGILLDDWMKFIDGLNIAIVGPTFCRHVELRRTSNNVLPGCQSTAASDRHGGLVYIWVMSECHRQSFLILPFLRHGDRFRVRCARTDA